jgi:catechol 2,3-dioxygenase-like lactoylglutathione lyase family enzyme
VKQSLATIAFLVPDYDVAIAWFRDALGFQLLADSPMGPGKRWVVVAPRGGAGASILLAKASDERQRAAIGAAAGGRVGFFLETDDFARDHAAMRARGVRFLEEPRHEAYGIVAVFVDLWGGKWDLLQRAPPGEGAAP